MLSFFSVFINMKLISIAAALAACLSASLAHSHIVLDQKTAFTGSYYRAAFRVGHGCEGAATTAISVRLPTGVRGAKPMPKIGWTLDRKIEKLAAPYTSHGKEVTEAVTEITWRGGSLADEHFDEFAVQMQLPETPGALWFKVLQTCAKGSIDWAETPASGMNTQGLKAPAALLEVLPAKPAEAHKH